MVSGELIGEIRILQQVMQRPVSPREELVKKNETELAQILDSLMVEWNTRR